MHQPVECFRAEYLCRRRCRVDMVLVGAEGVVENGGVINKLGTYQLSLCAHAHGIPFYVAAESYKVNLQCEQHLHPLCPIFVGPIRIHSSRPCFRRTSWPNELYSMSYVVIQQNYPSHRPHSGTWLLH